jgi:putative salt-induced outer membrane protein
MKLRDFWPALFLLVALQAQAQQEEEEDDPLSGNVTLGYLATSGNTETSSLNAAFKADYAAGKWLHEASASAINASEDNTTTAEAYELGWTSNWNLTERDFLFGRLNWRKDEFGGFNTQFSQTVGYARNVVENDKHNLRLEAGAGARQSEDQVGVKQDETILTGGLNYSYQFSETAQFRQTIKIEAGDQNTFSESVTAVSAQLIGRLALTASFTYRNNSDVPVDTENTDTRTAISLEYAF